MSQPIDMYWKIRLNDIQEQLQANNFAVSVAADTNEARHIVLDTIIPEIKPQSLAWGGSVTVVESGLYDALKTSRDMDVIDTMDRSIPAKELVARRRHALLADLFITGTNALTEDGQLVNLDMIGNRVGPLTFGPEHVIVLVGRNKIVVDLEDAMARIKDVAAPANAIRLGMKTPCAKTAFCHDCSSPERICNSWTITEKSYPKGRINVILINSDVGL